MVNTLPQGLPAETTTRGDRNNVIRNGESTSLADSFSRNNLPESPGSLKSEKDSEIVGGEVEDLLNSDESEQEVVSRKLVGGGTPSRGAEEELANVFKAEPVDFVAEPVSRLRESLARCMRLEIDFTDATAYFHEGTELLNDLRNQLAVLPELKDLSPKADLTTSDIGEPGVTTKEMEDQVRGILGKHHVSFLGDGYAVPAPARGVVCDLNLITLIPWLRDRDPFVLNTFGKCMNYSRS